MKKLISVLVAGLMIFGVLVGWSYIKSPDEDQSALSVAAFHAGMNDSGDPVVELHFTLDLNGRPVFSGHEAIIMDWSEGWQPRNLQVNGESRNAEITHEYKEPGVGQTMRFAIDPGVDLDSTGNLEGILTLTGSDEDILTATVYSAFAVSFTYESLIKDFFVTDSVGFYNEIASEEQISGRD